MERRKPITVVAGWIEYRGRILLTQRPWGVPNGGCWELPGGKVEPGESLQEALKREIEEELRLLVIPKRPLAEVYHHYPHISIRLVAVLSRAMGRGLTPVECSDWRWLTPGQIFSSLRHRHLNLAPADRRLIRQIFGHP